MARIQTSYYGADATTQFQWATSDADLFSRTRDLYYMSQALELHDHTNGRGLAVGRLADGAITSASFGPLSVMTAALANLAVTTAKLADGAVTRPKIATPLIQATNNSTGGINLADSSAGYTTWWYVSATGQMVFGFGSTTAWFVNQSNQIAFGTTLPVNPCKFNFTQSGITAADGIKLQSPNNVNHIGISFVDASGNWVLSTATSALILNGSSTLISPSTDNSHQLGNGSLRWSNGYFVSCTILTFAASTITTSTLAAAGSISSGSLSTGGISGSTVNCGGITCTTINTQGNTITCGGISCGGITCTTINTQGNTITCATINASSGNLTAGTINDLGTLDVGLTSLFQEAVGINTTRPMSFWLTMGIDSAGKPGTSTWVVVSDSRAKVSSEFRSFTDGLAVLRKLEPEYFTYNGKFGTPKGAEFVGMR